MQHRSRRQHLAFVILGLAPLGACDGGGLAQTDLIGGKSDRDHRQVGYLPESNWGHPDRHCTGTVAIDRCTVVSAAHCTGAATQTFILPEIGESKPFAVASVLAYDGPPVAYPPDVINNQDDEASAPTAAFESHDVALYTLSHCVTSPDLEPLALASTAGPGERTVIGFGLSQSYSGPKPEAYPKDRLQAKMLQGGDLQLDAVYPNYQLLYAIVDLSNGQIQPTGDTAYLCHGDSGGPTLDADGKVVGIHSTGSCGDKTAMAVGGVDASVPTAYDWLENARCSHAQNDGSGAQPTSDDGKYHQCKATYGADRVRTIHCEAAEHVDPIYQRDPAVDASPYACRPSCSALADGNPGLVCSDQPPGSDQVSLGESWDCAYCSIPKASADPSTGCNPWDDDC